MESRQSVGRNRTFSHSHKAIKTLFHKRGLKCTPQRLAVLGILGESPRHFSVMEIYKKVKKVLPEIGLATVYRALEALVGLGLIVRVHLEDGCHSYKVAPIGHQHSIVCMECNRVMDFAECPIEDISRRLSKQTGFAIQKHFLQLFGKCRACQSDVSERR